VSTTVVPDSLSCSNDSRDRRHAATRRHVHRVARKRGQEYRARDARLTNLSPAVHGWIPGESTKLSHRGCHHLFRRHEGTDHEDALAGDGIRCQAKDRRPVRPRATNPGRADPWFLARSRHLERVRSVLGEDDIIQVRTVIPRGERRTGRVAGLTWSLKFNEGRAMTRVTCQGRSVTSANQIRTATKSSGHPSVGDFVPPPSWASS
jgi:hypothetical protein